LRKAIDAVLASGGRYIRRQNSKKIYIFFIEVLKVKRKSVILPYYIANKNMFTTDIHVGDIFLANMFLSDMFLSNMFLSDMFLSDMVV
jgi:hypothetical protein